MADDEDTSTSRDRKILQCVYISSSPSTPSTTLSDDERADCADVQDILKRPQPNNWTKRQRQALCLMYALYVHEVEKFTQIFNEVFASEVEVKGKEKGLKRGTIVAQFENMKAGLTGYDVWKTCFEQYSFDQLRINLGPLRNEIEDAARYLGILLKLRVDTHPSLLRSGHRLNRSKRKRSDIRGVLGDDLVNLSDLDSDDSPSAKRVRRRAMQRQRQRQRQRQGSKHYPMIRFETDGDLSATRSLPPLLYRFADTESQGVNQRDVILAGLFATSSTIVSSAEFDGGTFEEALSTHLNRVPRSTPL